MKCSIIIPTYNGAHKIGNLLTSLQTQTYQDFEVIVVVDGSTDNTVDVIEQYKSSLPQLRVIVNKNQGRSKTRNAGANLAKGELLVFYDDDVIADNDSIYRHVSFHQDHNEKVIVTGTHRELPGKIDVQKYRAYLATFWRTKYKEDVTRMDVDNLFFAAGNCSIPKNVFDQLQGFDVRLLNVEDYDLAYRALKANIPAYFDKRNMATHCDLISCRSYIKRQREYDLGKKERNRITGTVESKNFFKHIIYRAFAFKFLVKAIDKNYLVVLPKKVRYKLYDVVIHALSVEYPTVQL